MTTPVPFAYPTSPHVRCHGPKGYKNYGDFKPFLRDEFVFRCVYCLERELWYPNGNGSFSADHFTPRKVDPAREADYENLVYACVRCNSFKQAKIVFLDPEKVAFADHLRVRDDGHIEGLTPEGRNLIELMHLDEDDALRTRKRILRVLEIKADHPDDPVVDAHLVDFFGFPSDLPDLSRPDPPDGNSKPEGIPNSHFERRQKGALPAIY